MQTRKKFAGSKDAKKNEKNLKKKNETQIAFTRTSGAYVNIV